jgi:hypothetical protein
MHSCTCPNTRSIPPGSHITPRAETPTLCSGSRRSPATGLPPAERTGKRPRSIAARSGSPEACRRRRARRSSDDGLRVLPDGRERRADRGDLEHAEPLPLRRRPPQRRQLTALALAHPLVSRPYPGSETGRLAGRGAARDAAARARARRGLREPRLPLPRRIARRRRCRVGEAGARSRTEHRRRRDRGVRARHDRCRRVCTRRPAQR